MIIADQIAVRIVIVTCDYRALSVYNGHHVTLQVGDVIVENTIVLQCIGIAIGIVEEVQSIAVEAFPQQFTTGIIIGVLNSVDRFAGSQTVRVIGVADGIGSIAGVCKPSAMLTGASPSAVVQGGSRCCRRKFLHHRKSSADRSIPSPPREGRESV